MTITPAGWYSDPHGGEDQRYWDGQQWTKHTAPGSALPPPHSQEVPAAPPTVDAGPSHTGGSNGNWFARHKIMTALLAFILVGSLAGYLVSRSGDNGGDEKSTAAKTTFDVHGTLVLTTADLDHAGSECFGTNGYDDISAGAQVVIYNNTGAAIASGSLGPGKGAGFMVRCKFKFTVRDVPISKTDLYSVEVTHRGKITFKRAEAGALGLTLG
jgi:hypothetical protein